MSLKTFINKYKNGSGGGSSCSQSSIGCYSQASTSSLSCMSQSNKQPSQNNISLSQLSQGGMASSGFVRGNSSNINNRMSVIEEEQVFSRQRQNNQVKSLINNASNSSSPFINNNNNNNSSNISSNANNKILQQYPNTFNNFQLNSSNFPNNFSINSQQNMLNTSFSNDNMNTSFNNLNSSKIFLSNNANMNSSRVHSNTSFNNTLNFQSTDNPNNTMNMNANNNTNNNQNLNYPPQHLNQSMMLRTAAYQPILPQELTSSNASLQNTFPSMNTNNNYQPIELNIPQNPLSYEDYVVKSKETQKARENKMKIDLLKEIHGVKEFFQDTILKELSNLAAQTIHKCSDYQNSLSELQTRVEDSAKVVNAFLDKSEFTDRQKVVDSEYGRDLSELHDLVIKTRQTVEQSDKAMALALDRTLTQSAKAIEVKIKQTKKSIKKQILQQIKSDKLAKGNTQRVTRLNGKRKSNQSLQ